jgi:DNA-binding LytR/AlgR family response regulator
MIPTHIARALLVEDEPYPRAQLTEFLATLWPELQVVGQAVDGPQGLALFDALRPDIVFIDIQLPGFSGLELARHTAGRGHVVFVTALDAHAIAAFEQGAVDYILKPIALERLAHTVSRLKARLSAPPPDVGQLLLQLTQSNPPATAPPLRWLQVGDGQQLRLIMVADVLYFESDTKYTRVVTRDGDALIRTSVRELLTQLDGEQFWQVHRSTIVNLAAVHSVHREALGRMSITLKGRTERLTVSQTFQSRFKLS